jgi:predicted O-methyltransferase YrrM
VELSGHDLTALHAPPHPLLVEIEGRAKTDGVPVVSRETGRLLSTLVTAMQASRILEVGTGYGDATLWMALAQPRMGKIWTMLSDLRRTEIARSYFQRAGEDDYIEISSTPALEMLDNFSHRNLDIAFVAADESEYGRYFTLIVPMLKLSGLAIFDRALRAPRAFLESFLHHPQLDATLLQIGDGIAIGARRK